ncbi:MgtC/SapB family protein [Demetria terragena]|uniref:MgtC/SapB family protein n=1 Tax=Demetria terragena TaxID=63959 RepID=UPI001B7FAA84|nr:MgtC/SapB family protein [Demetria terragena]
MGLTGLDWFPVGLSAQGVLLGIAVVLSAIIGLERHTKLQTAGLRTHALVGLGSAAFTLVSAHGFASSASATAIVDPSRIAAQVVSGIGFIGAGVIFVRRGSVRGLTTAASIWVAAAVGMLAAAEMPLIAVLATILHLLTTRVLPLLGGRVGRRYQISQQTIVVNYMEGYGALREVMNTLLDHDCESQLIESKRLDTTDDQSNIEVSLRIRYQGALRSDFLDHLIQLPGVNRAATGSKDSVRYRPPRQSKALPQGKNDA